MRGVRGKASFIANIDLAFNAKTMQCEINNVLGTWSQKQRHIRFNVFSVIFGTARQETGKKATATERERKADR